LLYFVSVSDKIFSDHPIEVRKIFLGLKMHFVRRIRVQPQTLEIMVFHTNIKLR
jgi:hypothetical protein